ncbi:hypothetical protein [Lysobacter sp. HA35]
MASAWPSTLPQTPLMDGVSYVPWRNAVRTDMDAGVPKTRRRFTAVGDDVRLAILIDRTQCDTLDTFYQVTLKTVLPFTWKHFRKAGYPTCDYRFKSPPQFTPAGGTLWRAELELERLP